MNTILIAFVVLGVGTLAIHLGAEKIRLWLYGPEKVPSEWPMKTDADCYQIALGLFHPGIECDHAGRYIYARLPDFLVGIRDQVQADMGKSYNARKERNWLRHINCVAGVCQCHKTGDPGIISECGRYGCPTCRTIIWRKYMEAEY